MPCLSSGIQHWRQWRESRPEAAGRLQAAGMFLELKSPILVLLNAPQLNLSVATVGRVSVLASMALSAVIFHSLLFSKISRNFLIFTLFFDF